MQEFPCSRDGEGYDRFAGRIIIVDLADVSRETEAFEGRDWLEECVRSKSPIGWDLEWQPDRSKDFDNPVALMQFADAKTALLVRTHRSRQWLPASIMWALRSEGCKKVGVGWDGADKKKMQLTFGFLPVGIEDLAEIAKRKGLSELGLKSLSERFGWRMLKDHHMARSNWAQWQPLTPEQARYAAEDAYFTILLYDALQALPDRVAPDAPSTEPLPPALAAEGIELRPDGFWCTHCDKGPMTAALIAERHVASSKHQRRVSAAGELPEDLADEGIVADEAGTYRCVRCGAGPFGAWTVARAHVASKKHSQRRSTGGELPEDLADEGIVADDAGTYRCARCDAGPFTGWGVARAHVASKRHAKRAPNRPEGGHTPQARGAQGDSPMSPIRERRGLEPQTAVSPVAEIVRAMQVSAGGALSEPSPPSGVLDAASGRLPPGWRFVDAATCYYADLETRASQWHEPEAYEHGDWSWSAEGGRARWTRTRPTCVSFFEGDPGWERLEDRGRAYWSCPSKRIRFFERPPEN